MSDRAPGDAGDPRPPRQHAYPTAVQPGGDGPTAGTWGAGPQGTGTWGPGPAWPGGNRRDDGAGPGGSPPHGDGNGGGGWWGGSRPPAPPAPPPRRTSPTRRLVWALVVVAVVVLLVRANRLTTGEVILFCILVPSLILHEISHGLVALAFGDDTAKRAGRLSLNPLRHVDLVGTIIVPAITVLSGFGFFGWAKPVPVNVQRLRSPRNQGVLVSLAGPLTNVVIAGVAGVAFSALFVAGRTVPAVGGWWPQIVFDIGAVNLWVACFNLIPIPPLDGSALLERLLPSAWWPGYLRIRPYGLFVILGGLVLLSMAHLYPLQAIFGHIFVWWEHLLGV